MTEDEKKLAIRQELGRGTWNMLHRMAAKYDKEPTARKRQEVVTFFKLLGDFYPCTECAAHFRDMLKENPVEPGNNRELSLWLCRVHNIVNRRLGKAEFPCTLEALKDRWGSCGCFDAAANATAAGDGAGPENAGDTEAAGRRASADFAAVAEAWGSV
jgi:FAD-linked sulfhydryl oxidase